MRTILLDPGHGGTDPGAVNEKYNLKEKDIVLDIAVDLASVLYVRGYKVLLTRNSDVFVPLPKRLSTTNLLSPDAFISIHCNSSTNPKANGIEILVRDDNDYELAECLLIPLLAFTRLNSRGVKRDVKDLNRRLAVLSCRTEIPACLVEVGFISNEQDIEVLRNHLIIVNALADGIDEYFKRKGGK